MARYSATWFRTETTLTPQHGRMLCSYCGSEMAAVTTRQKRPVPPGAKDLGLFDDIVCWQCPQCEAKNEQGITRCGCGKYAVHEEYARSAPETPVRLLLRTTPHADTYGCTDCEPCGVCDAPLNTHDYTWHTETVSAYTGQSAHHTTYFHQECAEKMRQEQLRRGNARQETGGLDDKRWQESQMKALEKEYEQERMRAEALRRAEGLCTVCGKPMGFMDKLLKRDVHPGCRFRV